MLRPNPLFPESDLYALLVGSGLQWESEGLRLRARSVVERGLLLERAAGGASADFSQITTDALVQFLTFGEQDYGMDVHWVTTLGQTPPPQRFVYIGGSGTLPFLEMLEQGGDELLLIDQRYGIPLLNVRFGILGIPTLQFRHRLGSAGLGMLPSFEQVIGFGVMLTVVRGEIQMDPATGKVRVGAGFTFSR